MPFPGPPAEKDPPPPSNMFKTQYATKSSSLCDELSRAITKCASSGIGVGPRLTLERSASSYEITYKYFLFKNINIKFS